MASKEFKTIQEQISLLQSRGLQITDLKSAENFLLKNNYYRISGYSLTLRDHDTFYPGTTFQNIIDIYSFDHEFRHLLLCFIERIEITIKSLYTYEFTKVHGAIGYLNPCFFTDSQKHDIILKKVNDQKLKRHNHEAYLKHFMDDLKQPIPLWASIDLFTISDISIFYSISEISIQKKIAAHLNLRTTTGYVILGKFMHSMTILRNLCAHGSRLFNRLFEQKPSLSKSEQLLLIHDEKGHIDNAHLYGFVLIMRRLLTTEDFSEFKQNLIAITKKYPFVNMRYYGFRDDWINSL